MPSPRISDDWQADVLEEIGAESDGLIALSADQAPADPPFGAAEPGPPASYWVPSTDPADPLPEDPMWSTKVDRISATWSEIPPPSRQEPSKPHPTQSPPPEPVQPRTPSDEDRALIGRPVHGAPILSRVLHGLRNVAGASVSRDVHDWTETVARLQRPVTTTRRIAVTGLRGGSGKTTIAALMASALAQHRHDRVLLVDADPEFGTVRLRLGITSAPSPQELVGRQFESFEDARPFLAWTDSGLWVLPGAAPGTGAAPDPDTFQAATALYRFFAVVVVDCGAGLDGELQRNVLETAHSHLNVSPATVDGAVSATRALEWLGANGYGELVPHTVTAFAAHSPHGQADLTPAAELLRANGAGVEHLAYDRHLASGGLLDLSLLAESTRFAAVRIAAEVLDRTRS